MPGGQIASIVGIGQTDWVADNRRTRAGEKPDTAIGYGATAFRAALTDSGLAKSDIDGLIVGPTTPYERLGEILGIDPRWGGQADAGMAMIQACMAIQAGQAETVALVYGTDQKSASVQYGGADTASGHNYLGYVYHAPWGFTSQGAIYALMFRRYGELFGFGEKDLGQVAIAQRMAATLNPNAIMRKPITVDDYLSAAYVCEPLRLLDYCLVNDGGVALIVTTPERARRLTQTDVQVLGYGRADVNSGTASLEPRLTDFFRPFQQAAGERSFAMSGLGPDDMDSAQVYDSFSLHVPMALEGYGYCAPGDAAAFMGERGIALGGALPVNTSGGHLSESYMQGWNHQLEAVRQLRHACGERQVENCRLVHYSADAAGKCVSIVYGRGDA